MQRNRSCPPNCPRGISDVKLRLPTPLVFPLITMNSVSVISSNETKQNLKSAQFYLDFRCQHWISWIHVHSLSQITCAILHQCTSAFPLPSCRLNHERPVLILTPIWHQSHFIWLSPTLISRSLGPNSRFTHRLKSLSTGLQTTGLPCISGLSTSHAYCSISRSSHFCKSILPPLRIRSWALTWTREGSSSAEKVSTGGDMVIWLREPGGRRVSWICWNRSGFNQKEIKWWLLWRRLEGDS